MIEMQRSFYKYILVIEFPFRQDSSMEDKTIAMKGVEKKDNQKI